MDLLDWTKIHVRHQDLLKKRIEKIQEHNDSLTIHNKDGTQETWLVQERLDLTNTNVKAIVTLNTKKNLKTLIQRYKDVKESPVKIFFANPKTNDRWVLVPSHHTRVADQKNLKAGLESMAQSTPFLKE